MYIHLTWLYKLIWFRTCKKYYNRKLSQFRPCGTDRRYEITIVMQRARISVGMVYVRTGVQWLDVAAEMCGGGGCTFTLAGVTAPEYRSQAGSGAAPVLAAAGCAAQLRDRSSPCVNTMVRCA